MNQSACSRSRPVPIAMRWSMVVRWGEHLRILDSQSAASSDPIALSLDNNAHHDSEPIDIRFYGQICRIWDLIVRILDLHAPQHRGIALSEKRYFWQSDGCQHHPTRYGARYIKRRSNILRNKPALIFELLEVKDPIWCRTSNKWWEWISFARNWCLMHKYTANKVLRSRNSMYLVNFRLSVASTHRPCKSDSPLKPKYFRQCENQA